MIASPEDIDMCSIGKWYDSFFGKTFKSRIIPLSREFVTYLGEDGVILPKCSKNYFSGDVLSDDEDEQLKEIDTDDSSSAPDFSELDQQIARAIRELEGDVIVKLNWSCPIDAVWVNAGTLKCKSPSDVYLMLKSSDRIMFDLEHMYDLCDDADNGNRTNVTASTTSADSSESTTKPTLSKDEVTLVLRKWANLNPAMEFRVFVHNKQITGICQRDCSTYYDFLEEKIDEIQDLIYDFFYGSSTNSSTNSSTSVGKSSGGNNNSSGNSSVGAMEKETFNVVNRFPLHNYAMDVYVDNRKRVWLIDFNPFGEPTCSLLFEWEELAISAVSSDAAEPSCDMTLRDHEIARANLEPIEDTLSIKSVREKEDEKEYMGKSDPSETSKESGSISRAVAPVHDFCEFRFIEDSGSVLPSTKGSSRGPIDVHAASEFSQFMKLCKAQHADASESDSSDE